MRGEPRVVGERGSVERESGEGEWRGKVEREGGLESCTMARKLSLIAFYPSAIRTAS